MPIKNLRIAHVTATFPPYYGGAGTVCYHNARELARLRHEVHVFTAAMGKAPVHELLDGFSVHRLPALFRIGNMPVLPSLPLALRGFDIVHLHYPFILGAEMVRLATALSRTPLIVSFHNDLIGEGLRASIFKLYQSLSAHLVIQNATRLCVLSHDHFEYSRLRQSLVDSNLKIVELPNGVDLSLFHPLDTGNLVRSKYGIPETVKLVLFVAALDRAHHFKGLNDLLLAVQTLSSDIWLLVIGDGDLRKEYERQARELGVSSRVIFTGAVPHEDLPPYFRSADVTILPSSQTESFGLVLIESLACGTPVIASSLPGVRTVVNHGSDGLLVAPNDPLALAEAILTILKDELLRQVMGRRGRDKVEERYGWEQIGLRIEKIYAHVLEGNETSWESAHA
ncbi:MAG TPA: glycosyltransferase family 4 protein [Anaerolineales bacterium]|nr:glycosyltransferase family 4 protein [Anaerolineales bacterium]